MIKLFESNITNFNNNGLCILNNATRAYSEEVLNNIYIAEFEVIYDEKGKWKELINGRIIFGDEQPFRIYKTVKNLRSLTVYTRHVFWDLLNNEVRDVRPTDKTAQGAMSDILSDTNYEHPFTAFSDIETINTQYYINRNPVDCLMGSDSLITRWGGELKLNKWLISVLGQRGADTGVSIAYRKNMLSIDVEEDYDSLITRMRPVGNDGLELPEVYIDSPYIENYPSPVIREVNFDIGIDEENEITEAMAIEQLRAAANQYYIDTKCDIPLTNIKVDMALLENTEEYKEFKNLVKVNLGDIVTCKHIDLGINYKAKVIRIKKDLLTGKNAEVELGSFKQNLSNAFTKITNTLNDMSTIIANNKSSLQSAIDNATELLTTALGGYVVKRNGELLIMDTEDPETATKVWRWNINGLGFSGTGINGPYGLAITMDGKIVADFITVGTLYGINIDAVNMTGSVITGSTVRTSAGVNRIQMNDDSLKAYYSNVKRAEIDYRSSKFYDPAGTLLGTITADTNEHDGATNIFGIYVPYSETYGRLLNIIVPKMIIEQGNNIGESQFIMEGGLITLFGRDVEVNNTVFEEVETVKHNFIRNTWVGMKLLNNSATVQVRSANDDAYATLTSGNLRYYGDLVNASDRRLKKNITALELDALDVINQIPMYTFLYNQEDENVADPHYGTMFDEAPNEIRTKTEVYDDPEQNGIDTTKMLWINTIAIKQLNETIIALQDEINDLYDENKNLSEKLKDLESRLYSLEIN